MPEPGPAEGPAPDDPAPDLIEEQILHDLVSRWRPPPIETDEIVDSILRRYLGRCTDGVSGVGGAR